jgi:hypothetical protein
MDLTETWLEFVGWIELAKNRDYWPALVNTVINPPFPQNEFLGQVSDYQVMKRLQMGRSY